MKCVNMLLAIVALCAFGACARGQQVGNSTSPDKGSTAADKGSAPPDKQEAQSWNPAALKTAEELAAKVRAGGMQCDEFGSAPFEAYEEQYKNKAPLPAAMAGCTAEDDEDLLFEVFVDAKHAREFIETKRALLCRRAVEIKLPQFPGFSYVDGGTWIIEPDEKATADKLAPILGAQAKTATCDQH